MTHKYKYSEGKVRYDLVDPEAVHGIAQALTHGQEKGYEEYSWQKVPVTEYVGAYQRHMREHMRYLNTGKLEHAIDKESGLLHIDHATTCLMFIRWNATQDKKIIKYLENKESALETAKL